MATEIRDIEKISSGMRQSRSDPPDRDILLLLERLELFKIHGRDKSGRKILRIIGKFFPASVLNGAEGAESLKRYLEQRIFPEIGEDRFSVLYVHTCVNRQDNYPGLSFLRWIYDRFPASIREGMEAVYFVHPGLQSRLFFATIGRFLFSAGLYGKLRYVSRLEFLGEFMRRGEIQVPEFVHDHDEELERRPLMDYGLESGRHLRDYDDSSAASMYSLRCIS